jgi:CRISPR-associated protein Cas6
MAKVDVAFPVSGTTIPADHGYTLYSAICRLIPSLHPPDADDVGAATVRELWSEVGIHFISARPCGNRMLELEPRSKLRVRIDEDQIAALLPLSGRALPLDGATVRLGIPRIEMLRPAVRLRSRVVVIKGFLEPEPFLGAVARQLVLMNVTARPGIPFRKEKPEPESGKSPLVRRTLAIRGKTVVGFAVEVDGLTAEESIRLQESGVGGRRRFGCGLFDPARA